MAVGAGVAVGCGVGDGDGTAVGSDVAVAAIVTVGSGVGEEGAAGGSHARHVLRRVASKATTALDMWRLRVRDG